MKSEELLVQLNMVFVNKVQMRKELNSTEAKSVKLERRVGELERTHSRFSDNPYTIRTKLTKRMNAGRVFAAEECTTESAESGAQFQLANTVLRTFDDPPTGPLISCKTNKKQMKR